MDKNLRNGSNCCSCACGNSDINLFAFNRKCGRTNLPVCNLCDADQNTGSLVADDDIIVRVSGDYAFTKDDMRRFLAKEMVNTKHIGIGMEVIKNNNDMLGVHFHQLGILDQYAKNGFSSIESWLPSEDPRNILLHCFVFFESLHFSASMALRIGDCELNTIKLNGFRFHFFYRFITCSYKYRSNLVCR